jgi:methanogenic corrinoid protein MtbC1
MKAALKGSEDSKKPLAIGGSPEGDPYLLANLMAEMALANLGWSVVNLGPNTPLRSFRAALTQLRPRLLWISVGYPTDPASFASAYRELYREATRLGVAVALGGRAVTEGLRADLPCTTSGQGLTHLVQFARSLHPSAHRPRRGRPPGG